MIEDFVKVRGMVFPRNVQIGHDILPTIGETCKSFNFDKNTLIITGDETYRVAGKDVQSYMEDAGYTVSVHKTKNATIDNVNKAVEAAKESKSKFILAVGGGSKIDISKLAAMKLNIPFISIPTSAAHDGIASDRASLKSDVGPKSIEAITPMGVIADTKVIAQSDYRLLASGCADVISNLTALKDWEFAKRLKNEPFSSSAYALSMHSAETIIESSDLIREGIEESVWIAMRPIIISGVAMSVAGNSRPTSGSEHMFSHALDILHPGKALHGEQCGVGSIMMMYLHGGDWKRIRNALLNIKAPVCANDLGLSADDIVDALTEAHKIRKDRFTILGDKGLSRDAARVIAEKTKVI